ncbi:MAG: hypothetical protein HC769_00090 [Cyanobacteria bacterium CRU_2_1]|nr:hypothetical protein [Cyanobacteria bacterium RU_5_0]NJR57381.1 hypothetical protein [Cyanobacteria bacterium CRU_2_1]
MESAHYIPMRALIRYKAKVSLRNDVESGEISACLDDGLIKEIAVTLFHSEFYQTRYSQCRSKREARGIDEQMAAEVAKTYKRITQQQEDPIVQQLNSLL